MPLMRILCLLLLVLAACGHSSSPVADLHEKEKEKIPEIQLPPSSPPSSSETVASAKANATSALAINIDGADYWSPQWTYVNIMHASSNWFPQCSPWRTDGNQQACLALDRDPNPANNWDTGEQLDLDQEGWVRSLPPLNDTRRIYRFATVVMFLGARGHYPAGKYTVLYDGDGVIEYGADAVQDVSASTAGRHVFTVTTPTNGGIKLTITKTDLQQNGNYIRNIRVIVPGGICNGDPLSHHRDTTSCSAAGDRYQSFEEIHEQQLFHPLFLKNLSRFKALRLMAFAYTSYSSVADWNDRAQMQAHRWNQWHKGPPPEIFLHLANKIVADPWINLPHMASDDYIRELATLTKQMLGEKQKVYLEYSNEVWNHTYPYSIAGDYVEQEGLSQWPRVTPFEARLNAYAKRTVEMCRIWKQVFVDAPQRVVCVMGSQAGSDWVSEQVLSCPLYTAENGNIPCADIVDALAIAPYFGFLVDDAKVATVRSWIREADGGMTKVFEDLQRGNFLQTAFGYMEEHARVAEAHDVDLIAYEGGQHLVALGNVLNNSYRDIHDLLAKANRDERMGELYMQYLEGWKERGGKLFSLFSNISTPGPHGSWGAREFETDDEATKWKAIQEFMNNHSRWWGE